MKRGSPANGSPLGVMTSQMTRAVPRLPSGPAPSVPWPGCQGISAKVAMSGRSHWSLSAMRVKPSIELPSNQVPCSTEPASWCSGIVTLLTMPRMSVNWSWTKRILCSLAASIFESASISRNSIVNAVLLAPTAGVTPDARASRTIGGHRTP